MMNWEPFDAVDGSLFYAFRPETAELAGPPNELMVDTFYAGVLSSFC